MINMPNPRSDWKPTEFELIKQRIAADREGFITRLSKNLRQEGDCRIWTAKVDKNGYARINFRLPAPRRRGEPGKMMQIGVHRLFLTLELCRPIKPLHEAGHLPECCNPLCVKHVEEQTREQNIKAVRRGNQKTDSDCPF